MTTSEPSEEQNDCPGRFAVTIDRLLENDEIWTQNWDNNATEQTRVTSNSTFEVALHGRDGTPQDCVVYARLDSPGPREEWEKYISMKRQSNTLNPIIEDADYVSKPQALYHRIADPHEIRLFEMLPSPSRSAAIIGRLHTVSVEFEYSRQNGTASRRLTKHALSLTEGRPVCYTALSYTWGTSHFGSSITIDGCRKDITDLLLTALQHLRHPSHSVMLWIDQLCIDQDDLQDKENQIKLMATIYQRAWNTVIWIGDEPDHGAFDVLQRMFEATIGRTENFLEDEREQLRQSSREDARAYDNLLRLLDKPWFKRTWIIQEVFLSEDPYLMTGNSVVHWQHFASWCAAIKSFGIVKYPDDGTVGVQTRDLRVSGLAIAGEMYLNRSYFRQFQEPMRDLLSNLNETRYAQVTNPLDKVYGILGLCRKTGILPDYSKSIYELYHGVALESLESELEIYQEASRRISSTRRPHLPGTQLFQSIDHESGETGLPSWVPDWARPRMTACLGHYRSWHSLFQAGGSCYPPCPIIGGNGRSITRTAKIFDTISQLCSIFVTADLSENEPATSNHSLREAINFTRTLPPSGNMAEGLFLTLVKTLVAGKDGSDGAGRFGYPPEYTEIFSLLCDETSGLQPSIPDQVYSPRQTKGHMRLTHLKRRGPGRAFQGLKQAYSAAILNRLLCWSRNRFLGLVPRYAKPLEIICVFMGSPIPFLVRGRDDGAYELLGECYVHDLMDGRFFDDQTVSSRLIKLV